MSTGPIGKIWPAHPIEKSCWYLALLPSARFTWMTRTSSTAIGPVPSACDDSVTVWPLTDTLLNVALKKVSPTLTTSWPGHPPLIPIGLPTGARAGAAAPVLVGGDPAESALAMADAPMPTAPRAVPTNSTIVRFTISLQSTDVSLGRPVGRRARVLAGAGRCPALLVCSGVHVISSARSGCPCRLRGYITFRRPLHDHRRCQRLWVFTAL